MRRQSGQSAVELALAAPFLMLLLVLVLDLGRAIQAYVVVQSAAREAARYASYQPTDQAGIQQVVDDVLSQNGLQPGLATIAISGSSPGNPVRVTVSYQMPLILGLPWTSTVNIQTVVEAVIF